MADGKAGRPRKTPEIERKLEEYIDECRAKYIDGTLDHLPSHTDFFIKKDVVKRTYYQALEKYSTEKLEKLDTILNLLYEGYLIGGAANKKLDGGFCKFLLTQPFLNGNKYVDVAKMQLSGVDDEAIKVDVVQRFGDVMVKAEKEYNKNIGGG